MANIIEMLEQEEIARLGKNIPDFAPGDTVVVGVNVVEGNRKRVQAYEGVVISIRNRGLNSSFIVRKICSGEGVERTFQTYSPLIASIEVKRRGDVRRSKLYYLRERSGKSARIKEKLQARDREVMEPEAPAAIKILKKMKIDIYMITGDNQRTAKAIARKARIEEYAIPAAALKIKAKFQDFLNKLKAEKQESRALLFGIIY